MRADGLGRCQTTVPFSAAPPILGAVELRSGTMTFWMFDLPGDADEDEIRIYNSDRAHYDGLSWAGYYEINSFSAAQKLQPENPIAYSQYTLHIVVDKMTLGNLISLIFDLSLEEFPQDARRLIPRHNFF